MRLTILKKIRVGYLKIGANPVIARNKRRGKRKFKRPKLLKLKRYLIEQFSSIFKG
jgi:hypothetical protein